MRFKSNIIALLAFLLVFSIGYSDVFYDDVQSYDNKLNPNFIANYPAYSSGTGWTYWDIESSVDDTIYINNRKDTTEGDLFILVNTSRVYLSSYPYSIGILYRNQSHVRPDNIIYNEQGFLIKANNSLNQLPDGTTRGYSAYFVVNEVAGQTKVIINFRRCSSDLVNPSTCGSLLNSVTFDVDNSSITTAGTDAWFNKSIAFNVSCDADGTYKFYFDGVEKMSYNDRLYDEGSIFMYQHLLPTLFVKTDNLLITYQNFTLLGEMYPVAYPIYDSGDYSLINRKDNYVTDWIALNMPFGVQFSFYTPSGYMNPVTEITCPVRLWGEISGYPELIWRASDSNSANKCILEYEYTTIEIWDYGYFCIDASHCPISWQEKEESITVIQLPVTESWTSSGAWILSYKVLDTNSKLLYTSTNLKCSAPANLTFAVQYFDNNSCTDTYANTKFYNLTNIGVNPYNETECDVELDPNCYNGTIITPSLVPPTYCSTHPTDPLCENVTAPAPPQTPSEIAGITDPYDVDQGENLVYLILMPMFIATILIIIVSAIVGAYAGPIPAGMSFIALFIVVGAWGIYPVWLMLSVLIGCGAIAMYAFRDIFAGK